MLPYQKGILNIFISHLCFRSRSLSLSRARSRVRAHTTPFFPKTACLFCLFGVVFVQLKNFHSFGDVTISWEGLSRLGFKHQTLRFRSERSNPRGLRREFSNNHYISYILYICLLTQLSSRNFHKMVFFSSTGCETGWLEFKGHCYHRGHLKVQWSEAKVIIHIFLNLNFSHNLSPQEGWCTVIQKTSLRKRTLNLF